jgi:TRAP-type C4-dicarboxylate transport system substrate-binding protein
MKDTFVTGPNSLKGIKVRSQQNKVHLNMWSSLGASPVPIAVPEVPSSLQNNVVSGYDNTLLYGFAAQWYQAISKVTLSGHIYQPAVVVFNKEWFDALPADLQAVVMSTVEKDTKQGRHEIRLLNRPLAKNYQKAGIELYEPTAAEKASLKRATRGTWDKFRKRVPRGGKLLDKILEAL